MSPKDSPCEETLTVSPKDSTCEEALTVSPSYVRRPLLRHYRQVYCEKAITVSLSKCVPVRRPLECHHRKVYGTRRPLQSHHRKVYGTRRPLQSHHRKVYGARRAVIGHWPLLSSLPGLKKIKKIIQPDVGMPMITESCAFCCRSFIQSEVGGADHRLLILLLSASSCL